MCFISCFEKHRGKYNCQCVRIYVTSIEERKINVVIFRGMIRRNTDRPCFQMAGRVNYDVCCAIIPLQAPEIVIESINIKQS